MYEKVVDNFKTANHRKNRIKNGQIRFDADFKPEAAAAASFWIIAKDI